MEDTHNQGVAPPDNPLLAHGAAKLARLIAAGEISAREVVAAFIDRIEAVNPDLNAICWPLLEQAADSASAADKAQARGEPLGPLHGVPITIKESFAVADTPATMGLTTRRDERATTDAPLIARLKAAGAIVLGKTNVPQLLVLHETDNPVYGRTNNPHDLARTPGGSSGGEGAIIAAGGSPLGLGGDLGGSIRIPAHFCGIAGLKPTTFRLTKQGSSSNLRGMEAMHFQPGPMARRVEDLELAMQVLVGDGASEYQVSPVPWHESTRVEVSQLRIGVLTDDGYAKPRAAIRRAVDNAAKALCNAGAEVDEFQPPDAARGMALYFGLVGADGGADMRRLTHGSMLDPRVASIMRLAGTPRWARPALAKMIQMKGHPQLADIVRAAGPRSADSYWQLIHQANQYDRDFLTRLDDGRFDAIICPPHAVPAFGHGAGKPEAMTGASYAFIMNLLGIPCGVVPAGAIPPDDERGEAGLPIGVQVAARHWREDIVLAVMRAIEF